MRLVTARSRTRLSSFGRTSIVAVVSALAFGCAAGGGTVAALSPAAPLPPPGESGLLSDYSGLRPSEQSASMLLYRTAASARYSKIHFAPVEVWRGTKSGLAEVPS